MTATPIAVQQATIVQHCKVLHLPTVAGQCGALAEQAVTRRRSSAPVGVGRALTTESIVNAARRVPLLAGGRPVGLQNPIDERLHRVQGRLRAHP